MKTGKLATLVEGMEISNECTGTPTKNKNKPAARYCPTIVKRAIEVASTGATDAEVYAAIGISESCWYKWLRTKPDFVDAIAQARLPESIESEVAKLEERKRLAQKWIDDYVENQGEVVEETITTFKKGVTTTKKVKKGARPDMKLLSRILGVSTGQQQFNVTVSLAEPDDESDNEFNYSDDEDLEDI